MSEAILLPYFIVCRSLTDSESEESDVMITSCSRYGSNNSWLVSYCGCGPTFGACLTLFSMVVVNVEEKMRRENF